MKFRKKIHSIIDDVPCSSSIQSGQNGWFSNYWQPRYPSLNYPPGPGSGLSRQSSLDDLTSMETDQVFDYEDRFRVDRRKLENLILGRFEPIKESASDFFLRVSTHFVRGNPKSFQREEGTLVDINLRTSNFQ